MKTPRALAVLSLVALAQGCGQTSAPSAVASSAPPPDPLVFDTWVPGPCSPNGQPQGQCPPGELFRVRLVPVAEGLTNPRHVAFLPGGDLLIAELAGRVRLVHDGKLAPEPLAGWPAAGIDATNLQAVAVHPQFAANHFVYLYYVKSDADGRTTTALARARLEGSELADVREVFESDAWIAGGPIAGRAVFGPDGMIYLTINDHDKNNAIDDPSVRIFAQHLDSDVGKVLRLRDDGGIPADNPFVGRADANPEVFTYGHRNPTDFAWHPATGELWATEIGPMGGDELNRLVPGHNYGWPLVTLGKIYTGHLASDQPWSRPGMDNPVMFWVPAISPSSLLIYDGDKFPLWRGHFLIGALSGQQLQRVAFDQPPPQLERRESMLLPLDARVRDVRQGPDGFLYLAVERDQQSRPGSTKLTPNGSILKIEPAHD